MFGPRFWLQASPLWSLRQWMCKQASHSGGNTSPCWMCSGQITAECLLSLSLPSNLLPHLPLLWSLAVWRHVITHTWPPGAGGTHGQVRLNSPDPLFQPPDPHYSRTGTRTRTNTPPPTPSTPLASLPQLPVGPGELSSCQSAARFRNSSRCQFACPGARGPSGERARGERWGRGGGYKKRYSIIYNQSNHEGTNLRPLGL